MRFTSLINALWLTSLLVGAAGCGQPGGDAFSLRGENTVFRIDFDRAPRSAQTQPSRALPDDELCYVEVGDATIECFRVGSLLVLAPDDGELLVADNPIDDLTAAGRHGPPIEALRALGAVGVIGASIERLPQTLADYLGSDGENLDVARDAAFQLLGPHESELIAHGHDGPFTIRVRLTPVGRKVLTAALRPTLPSGTVIAQATSLTMSRQQTPRTRLPSSR